MSKLTRQQWGTLDLLGRSPKAPGSTFCEVSDQVWPFVMAMPGELIEFSVADHPRYAKLSSAGEAVLKYGHGPK